METALPTDFALKPTIRLSRAIALRDRMAVKRDGSRVRFDLQKVTRAIALAFHEVRTDNAQNPYRDDALALYGLDAATFQQVAQIAESVSMMLELFYRDGRHPTIEQVQDAVERSVAAAGEFEVARAFILYRARHAERRLSRYQNGTQSLSDYIAQSKYARHRADLGRRETFLEGVDRVRDMHLEFFSERRSDRLPVDLPADVADLAGDQAGTLTALLSDKTLDVLIHEVFAAVGRKEVLPSMRSMQFGGPAILTNHSRLFNCSFSCLDRVAFFREFFFMLLSGCGVGFSVQKHHTALLPHLPHRGPDEDLEVWHYTVADTIEGWCDALDALFRSHYEGKKIEFNYSLIRPKGAPLKTSGGKAPGHRPLKGALEKVGAILTEASGRALRTIELYDICMFVARAVLSGGVRRSATICLFSPDDDDMMNAKTGNWMEKHPQRTASNNSAVLSRREDNRAYFDKLFQVQKEFGEPGFYFCDNPDGGANPCVPADTWVMTDAGPRQVKDLIGKPFNALVNGKPFATTEKGFFATGVKRVLKVTTEEGFDLKLTPNHKVLVQQSWKRRRNPADREGAYLHVSATKWIEAGELNPGDRIVMHDHAQVQWAGFGGQDEGWLVGSLLGDGNLGPRSANLDYWGENRAEMASVAVEAMARCFPSSTARASTQKAYTRVTSRPMMNLAGRFGLTHTSKDLNEATESASSEFYAGFLRGWFDADGSVQGDRVKGVSIRLSSVKHHNLRVAQRMLLRLGIYSVIYPNRNRHRSINMLPDGRGGKREFAVQPLHDLMISGADLARYSQRVGFRDPQKRAALNEKLAGYKRVMNVTNFIATVVAVEEDEQTRVYDCTVPGPHAFDANGMYVHNCVEIALNPVIDWTLSDTEASNLYRYGYQGDLPGTTRLSGFQHCNLTTINAAAARTAADFYCAVIRAAAIGTLQAAYTDMAYLGPVTRIINEHDALLGISICGFMDNPDIFFDPAVLARGAKLARATNRFVARLLGINHAARVTCVKPEGTASLLLGAASGIHAHHSRRYFRRVQANRNEPVYQFFKSHNPQMTEVSVYNPTRDDSICFPVEAPAQAYTRADISAEKFLELVRLVQQTWVINGTDESNRNPELRHNVSNTCTVKPEEWEFVREFIWANRSFFTGISLLVDDGDKKYPQAPREEVTASEADIARWNGLQPVPVDYTQMLEAKDETALREIIACAGGVCDLQIHTG